MGCRGVLGTEPDSILVEIADVGRDINVDDASLCNVRARIADATTTRGQNEFGGHHPVVRVRRDVYVAKRKRSASFQTWKMFALKPPHSETSRRTIETRRRRRSVAMVAADVVCPCEAG